HRDTATRSVLSSSLETYSSAAVRAQPVDLYGVASAVYSGSRAPTAGMVYKLVEVDGIPVAKRSSHKQSRGGTKKAVRLARATGTIVEEIVYPAAGEAPATNGFQVRELQVPLVRKGAAVDGVATLAQSRELVARGLVSLPWEGLKLSAGEPAVPTTFLGEPAVPTTFLG
ncbi:nicotinate phosphoribosyltransferase, partial [Nocardia sp. NPDC058497]